jgi:hypothetical protein
MTALLIIMGIIILLAVLSKSKTLRIVFLIISLIVLAFLIWIIRLTGEDYEQEKHQELLIEQVWENLSKGDSIFIRPDVAVTHFYKKGREKLDEFGQKQINYTKTDTTNFFKINSVHEKYYYQNKTSFIGICLGKDSTLTKEGFHNKHRWVIIKPDQKLTELKITNEFALEKIGWRENFDSYFYNNTLGKNFYLKFSDISTTNNDRNYQE